jgi:hypothetical protein
VFSIPRPTSAIPCKGAGPLWGEGALPIALRGYGAAQQMLPTHASLAFIPAPSGSWAQAEPPSENKRRAQMYSALVASR